MILSQRLHAFALVLAIVFSAGAAGAQGMITHGSDSTVIGPGIKLAWTVRRGASEAETMVVIRAIPTDGLFHFIRVDGYDPFSKGRKVFVMTRPLERQTDLMIPRTEFADHPGTEFHFFKNTDDAAAGRPALTIFYHGVPDTTPEFAAREPMEAYLAHALR